MFAYGLAAASSGARRRPRRSVSPVALGHELGAVGPGVEQDQVEVGDPTPAERLDDAWVAAQRGVAFVELVGRHRRVLAWPRVPREHALVRERHDALVGVAVVAVPAHDLGLAGERVSPFASARLDGSLRSIEAKRHRSVTPRSDVTIATAARISSAVSGSSGWRGAHSGTNPMCRFTLDARPDAALAPVRGEARLRGTAHVRRRPVHAGPRRARRVRRRDRRRADGRARVRPAGSAVRPASDPRRELPARTSSGDRRRRVRTVADRRLRRRGRRARPAAGQPCRDRADRGRGRGRRAAAGDHRRRPLDHRAERARLRRGPRPGRPGAFRHPHRHRGGGVRGVASRTAR